jgi:RNA polymerase sigma factor (sigma-70 family)
LESGKLIKKCIQNNRKAQHQLFELYSDRLYVVALRYLKNRFASEEVIGNAFLKIFQSLDRFRYEGEIKFEAWMRRIVINEALMEIRKMRQMPAFTDEFPEFISISDTGENIYYNELVNLIDRLPDGYHLVFKLYVIEGYSHAEIAELLLISEGTSKSQLHKARIQLQQLLIKSEKE